MTVSDDELDALRELINIGVGRAAGALNDLTGHTVQLNVPWVDLIRPDRIGASIGGEPGCRLACVRLHFQGGLRGAADLIFPSASASKLVALLSGEETDPGSLDRLRAEVLTEIGNILLNGLMGSITNIVQEHLDYGVPVYLEETAEGLVASFQTAPEAALLLAQAQFFVGKSSFEIGGDRIDGEITILLGVDSLEHLVDCVQRLGEQARL